MKYTKFDDIPKLTRNASYHITVPWKSIESTFGLWNEFPQGVDLDPDFQRVHVWTESQQVRYVEYILRGGPHSKDILFNSINWNARGGDPEVIQLVDGKQRLEAARKFMRNELRVFGSYRREFTDWMRHTASFDFFVNDLDSRAEVLQWYLDLNAGGVVHTKEEIDKVRELLAREKQ